MFERKEKMYLAFHKDLTRMLSSRQLFVTYHSYGQYILYPWGYDKGSDAPNWRRMHRMAELAGNAMGKDSGHR